MTSFGNPCEIVGKCACGGDITIVTWWAGSPESVPPPTCDGCGQKYRFVTKLEKQEAN